MCSVEQCHQSMGLRQASILLCAAMLFTTPGILADVGSEPGDMRPPSIPLVTHDPYLSCWSNTNNLYDQWPSHWTGTIHAMNGMIRVDGTAKLFMGHPNDFDTVIPQTRLKVHATQTVYTFQDNDVALEVTFTSPLLLDDLDLLSRPISYITYKVWSVDGQAHDVQLYFDATGEWAVNETDQEVTWHRRNIAGLETMAIGTTAQNILGSKGDNRRIDWGYLLVSVPQAADVDTVITDVEDARNDFITSGNLPGSSDDAPPRQANDNWPGPCLMIDLGAVDANPVSRYMMIGYDDLYSGVYFNRPLRAWWRRDPTMTIEQAFEDAAAEYTTVMGRCDAFDAQLVADATTAGGAKYADICVMAYRQAIAAHKLMADVDGKPLFFSKENSSNGSMGTVDVTYPSTPLFLQYNTELVKGMLEFMCLYTETGRWQKPFVAHDLGTYPIANGQTYGADQPYEETGNMLILAAAIAKYEGNPDFARAHWDAMTSWVKYLENGGWDPQEQITTDDFTGSIAHSANLSVKAILGVASYAQLAGLLGDPVAEAHYMALAQEWATLWEANANDGNHYKLRFDQSSTWSMKYNLVWDEILDLHVFPSQIVPTEVSYYLNHQLNAYGLPLDNRANFTKTDWHMWTAVLADTTNDFLALIEPVWYYLNDSPNRVPMSDWYRTTDASVVGFRARSVVGGVFLKVLADETIPKQTTKSFNWEYHKVNYGGTTAGLTALLETSESNLHNWRYRFSQPSSSWNQESYNDSNWSLAPAPFGGDSVPGLTVQTTWESPNDDIWIRRKFNVSNPAAFDNLTLRLFHDDDVYVYLNGTLIYNVVQAWTTSYVNLNVSSVALPLLHAGENTLAIYCHDNGHGQGIDAGLYTSASSAAGVAAYWRFEEGVPGEVLPGTYGKTYADRLAAIDVSGNGNHLYAYNENNAAHGWSADVPAAQVPFTGDTNLVAIESLDTIPGLFTWSDQNQILTGDDLQAIRPAQFTIEASFKTTASGAYQTIVGRDGSNVDSNNAAHAPLYFQIDDEDHVSISFADGDGNWWSATSTITVTANQWYHLAGVSDGSTLSLYLDQLDGNGYQLVAATALSGGDTSLARDGVGNAWSVGRGMFEETDADRFLGVIDEVRISMLAMRPGQFLFAGAGCLGDIDNDGDSDVADLAALQSAFGSDPTDVNWNIAADIDINGTIGLSDVDALLAAIGQDCP